MKNILLSKTFWVQSIALLALLFPPAKAWFDANPVDYLAALAAVNVLVRFFTSGKVSIVPQDSGGKPAGTESIRMPMWLVWVAPAGCFMVGGLPACSADGWAAASDIPVRACYIDQAGNSICYSPLDGVTATVDRRSRK